ncbi:hypothetical protein PITC_025210 [Penicillium italicum]|uniref:Xylanolytic transcriptional activator regulatory domain-containing protein n=1 Tax=Penicillium italicum TaxID=40296 RepID=A0A0A2LFL6_PENIT|nr:hypothetical protein PITC_025210 [Penicillium italicum]
MLARNSTLPVSSAAHHSHSNATTGDTPGQKSLNAAFVQSPILEGLPLPDTSLTTQGQIDVSHDVMEISDNSENDEQARPPANTTRVRAPRPRVPSSGARARASAVPSARTALAAPGAVSTSKPTRQLKSSLPKMRRSDERFLLPEFRYKVMTNASIYESLKSYLVSMGETEDGTFPWWRVIQDFVHLFFEHFDHEYPVIHPYALEFGHDKTSWMVLLAVVTVGSQYSAFGNASQFSASFSEILCHAIAQNRPQSPESTTLSYVQSVFLSDVCLMFGGSHKAQLKLQYERNALVTLARILKVDPCMKTKVSQGPKQWRAWLARESRIRLLHCIFRNSNAFSSSYSIVNQYLGSMNFQRSSPVANHCGVAGMLTISSMYTSLIKEQSAHLTSTPSALRTLMFQSMDEVFAAIPTSAKPDYIAARDVIHHVLCLLRLVSLHVLESFSGWQGEDAEAGTSTNHLKDWMEKNASSARKCLWHAVCVFSTLKAKQKFACHDPLCFLIAFFYIWAFDTLVVAPEIEKLQASTKEIRLLDTREIHIWIAEGPNTQLNLVGVGNLTGKESPLRLLAEVSQIFSKRKSWSGLCRGLGSAVDQILRNQTIQTTPQGVPQVAPPTAPQTAPPAAPQTAPPAAPQEDSDTPVT